MSSTELIIAEIHRAINKLGGSAQPATPDEAQRALRALGADIDLLSIVDSWQDTLPRRGHSAALEKLECRGSAVPDRLCFQAAGQRLIRAQGECSQRPLLIASR
jgi:hypothetical protein